MTKKTKTPRDRRRIATSRGYSDFDYESLKAHDWNIVQDNLGVKLRPQLREQLSGITMLYAAAQMPRSTRPLSEVVQEIDLWRRQTEVLIKNLWASDLKTYKPNTKKLNLKQISETYFRFAQNIVTANYPLGQLAHFLEGAVAVSNYFIRLLKDPQFKGERKTELWLIWVALIITCCRDSGIEVQKPNKNNSGIEVHETNKKRKGLNPGFIVLLDKLQSTLNNPTTQANLDCKPVRKRPQSHARSPIGIAFKTGDSLGKNAKRALVLADENATAALLGLYLVWAAGLSQFGTGRLVHEEMKPTLARLNEQMKIISPERNDLNG